MNENTIPRWNLDSIFAPIGSEKYADSILQYEKSMENLENFLKSARKMMDEAPENFDFPLWLSAFLRESDKSGTLESDLGAFAYINYSVDTTNPLFLNNIAKIEEMQTRSVQISLGFRKILSENGEKLDGFFSRFPEFAEHRFLIFEEIEKTKHQMEPSEESLASDLQRTGGGAWSRLHEQIISNLGADGKTFNEIRNDAYSDDKVLRKKSWESEIRLLKQNEIALAACLNNLKGETNALNRRRNWSEAIDRALFSSRMERKTLDALIEAIEESLPKWREYFQAKARFLRKNGMTESETAGTDENPGIAFYDLFAPLSKSREGGDSLLSKKWTFGEAKEYVVERYRSFSEEMGNFAKNAFDKNWIDAECRSGKVGGAYDEDFATVHESRIMTNFTGAFSDIITLAHELGHAYHFSCMKGKPSALFHYPMTLAETASTFAETIVKQDMISKCSGSEKLQILDLDLQDAAQTLVDILSRFYFEKSVFEKRRESELGADDFRKLMERAQEKSYGNGLSKTERHDMIWAVKSHYYSPELDFYNFPYAFGQLFSSGLFALYRKEGEKFTGRYPKILSMTGSMSCEDLCLKSGFDITEREFWKGGIEMYLEEIEEFKNIAF